MVSQIVIPARNEEKCLGRLLRELRQVFGTCQRIIVVDNASEDSTAAEALEGGATLVLREEKVGKGYAVRRGLESAGPGLVFVCDADIRGLTASMIARLLAAHIENNALVSRLAIGRSPEFAPVTSLVARPFLSLSKFSDHSLKEPIGGLVLVDRDFVLSQHLLGGWGFDFGLTLSALELGSSLPEITVTGVTHRRKPIVNYIAMAHEVLRAGLIFTNALSWDHRDCIRCNSGVNIPL